MRTFAVDTADIEHTVLGIARQLKLTHQIRGGDLRREAVGINAVDGDGDIVGRDLVIVDKVLLDVIADRQRMFAPLG